MPITPTTTNVDLVINRVPSLDILKQMESAGQLQPNQLYTIPSESGEGLVTMQTKVLWTNPDPTQKFAEQSIDIPNLSDYDYVIFLIRQTANDNLNKNGPAEGTTKKQAQMIKQYYENVFKVTKDFATTRMTVAESAYRDFMKFIRWHVGQYAANAKQDKQGDVVTQQPQQTQQQTDDNKITTPA